MEREIKENIEWKNESEGVFSSTQIMKSDDGGVEEKVYKKEITAEEVKEGIEIINERMNKNQKQIKTHEEEINKLGKEPKKTSEMDKIAKILSDMNLIDKITKEKFEIKTLNEQMKLDKETKERREKFLSLRPKATGG